MLELLDFYDDGPKNRDGVWVDVGNEARVKIRPMDNPDYRTFTQAAKIKSGKGPMSDEQVKNLLEEAVAHTVLVDWEGIGLQGEVQKYSEEQALRIFKALPKFLDLVVTLAYEEERFREDEVQDVLDKLRPTSAGASSGAAKSSGSKS